MNAIIQLTAADINTTINHEPRIMDLKLAEALGFADQHMVRRLIERHNEALERFAGISVTVTENAGKRGRPGKTYWLTKKQALYICTKSETDRATEVTIEMVEVFDEVTNKGRAIEAAPTNVVAIPTVQKDERRRAPNLLRTREAVTWRKHLRLAQMHLAKMGETYPTVVRHKGDLTSIMGEHDRVDFTRETLRLPTGALVVPIEGGGWRYEPPEFEIN